MRWVALYTKGQQGYLAQEKPSACVIDVGGEHISRDWGGRGVITSRTGGISRNIRTKTRLGCWPSKKKSKLFLQVAGWSGGALVINIVP